MNLRGSIEVPAPAGAATNDVQSRCIAEPVSKGLVLFAFSISAATIFLVPTVSHAVLLSYEPFAGYTVGTDLPETPGTDPVVAGYTGDWQDIDFGHGEPQVQSGSLNYTDPLYYPETGDKVGNTSDNSDVNNSGRTFRLLHSSLAVTDSTTGTRYLSFLYQNGNNSGTVGYQMLALYNTNTADANRNFNAGATDNGALNGNEIGFGVDEAYTSTGTALDNGVHLFVVKFVLGSTAGSDSVTVWLDPTLGANDPVGGVSVTGQTLTWDRLVVDDYDGNSVSYDEIRWGDTFNDVTLVPEPSTLSMLLFGCVTFWLVGRKRAL